MIHQFWEGPMPTGIKQCIQSVRDMNPWTEYKLWDLASLPKLELQPLIDRCHSPREYSDVIRVELLYRYGGVWLDTDMECLKSLEPLHAITNGRWMVQDEYAWNIAGGAMVIISGVFGCSENDPWAKAMMDEIWSIYNWESENAAASHGEVEHMEYSYVWPFDRLVRKEATGWDRWILPKYLFHQDRNGYCYHHCGSSKPAEWSIL